MHSTLSWFGYSNMWCYDINTIMLLFLADKLLHSYRLLKSIHVCTIHSQMTVLYGGSILLRSAFVKTTLNIKLHQILI